MARKSKYDKVREAINAAPKINTDVDINIIRSNTRKDERKYKCSCCGNSWKVQKSNFSETKSILYQSNNGFITICNKCRDEYYYQLIDLFSGSEEKALAHMCVQFGWFFHDMAVETSRQTSTGRSRIGNYLAKINLNQTSMHGATDIDTIKFDYNNRTEEVIESAEHLEELQSKGLSNISIDILETWGSGFPDIDYKILNDHYKMLKKYNPNCDNNQEIFIKSLCHLNLIQTKALKENDTTGYIKANSEYAKTFKQAGLKTIEEKDNSNDATVGVTLATIGQYTPEEYYKDKDLYKDYDKLGEYIERHMCRPLKNLQHGTDERDFEYFVPDSNDILDGDDDE